MSKKKHYDEIVIEAASGPAGHDRMSMRGRRNYVGRTGRTEYDHLGGLNAPLGKKAARSLGKQFAEEILEGRDEDVTADRVVVMWNGKVEDVYMRHRR